MDDTYVCLPELSEDLTGQRFSISLTVPRLADVSDQLQRLE